MRRRKKIGQGRDKKTITCDSSHVAQVDDEAYQADNCIAFVRAQLLEDSPGVVAVIVAGYWWKCCGVTGVVRPSDFKTARSPITLAFF